MEARKLNFFLSGAFMDVINEAIAPQRWAKVTLTLSTLDITVSQLLLEVKNQLKSKLLKYTDNISLVDLYVNHIDYSRLLWFGKKFEAWGLNKTLLEIKMYKYAEVIIPFQKLALPEVTLEVLFCEQRLKKVRKANPFNYAQAKKLLSQIDEVNAEIEFINSIELKKASHFSEDYFMELSRLREIVFSYSLNVTQKNIIEATIKFPLDDIVDTLDQNNDLTLKALNAVLAKKIAEGDIQIFNAKEINVWDSMKQIRDILFHPCPQNRNTSYPYVAKETGFSMFKMDRVNIQSVTHRGDIVLKNGRVIFNIHIIRNDLTRDDYIIAKEENGLLGLTGREDNQTPPVTKESVIAYIQQMVCQEIDKQQKILIHAKTESNRRQYKNS
jgi:hypothetical protein